MIYHGFGIAREFNLWAFIGGMVMAGVPGAIQAFTLIAGRTPGEPPPPQPDSSSPEPSSPSPGA